MTGVLNPQAACGPPICFVRPENTWYQKTRFLRPFNHGGDAIAIRSRKKSTTLYSWWVVFASWSRWWEKRHYKLKVRSVADCKVIFSWSNRSRVVSVGERPLCRRYWRCEELQMNEKRQIKKWAASPSRTRGTTRIKPSIILKDCFKQK
jgi:hypothetical protein